MLIMDSSVKQNDRLWVFIASVFILSWVIWVPIVLLQDLAVVQSIGPLVFLVGVMSPSLLGIVFSYLSGGSSETKALLKRGVKGFKIVWLAAALVLLPVVAIGALGVAAVLTGSMNLVVDIPQGLMAFVMFPIILLMGGALFEEFGWRGFALDRLQSRWSAVVSSLILGIIWGVWHLPMFFLVGSSQNILLAYLPISTVLFFIEAILVTFVITWVYNNTGRSILGALLIHTTWNVTFSSFFFGVLTGFATDPTTLAGNIAVINMMELANIVFALLLAVVCVILVVKWGKDLGKTQET